MAVGVVMGWLLLGSLCFLLVLGGYQHRVAQWSSIGRCEELHRAGQTDQAIRRVIKGMRQFDPQILGWTRLFNNQQAFLAGLTNRLDEYRYIIANLGRPNPWLRPRPIVKPETGFDVSGHLRKLIDDYRVRLALISTFDPSYGWAWHRQLADLEMAVNAYADAFQTWEDGSCYGNAAYADLLEAAAMLAVAKKGLLRMTKFEMARRRSTPAPSPETDP